MTCHIEERLLSDKIERWCGMAKSDMTFHMAHRECLDMLAEHLGETIIPWCEASKIIAKLREAHYADCRKLINKPL